MLTYFQASKPQPYDGKRKGVVGVVLALTTISHQLDYLIHLAEERNARD